MICIKKICCTTLCFFISFPALASGKITTHDFSFPDAVSGKKFELAKQAAQWTLLAFWRVDCESCVADMPVLAEFSTRNNSMRVLGLSLSRKEESQEYWQKMAMPFPTLINTGFPGELLEEYGNTLGAVPYTVLLKPDRTICWSAIGKITPAMLQEALQHCQALPVV
jgi:peroxiredoxin